MQVHNYNMQRIQLTSYLFDGILNSLHKWLVTYTHANFIS